MTFLPLVAAGPVISAGAISGASISAAVAAGGGFSTFQMASLAFSAIGAITGAAGALQQGAALQAQANYQAQVARNNAIIAQRSAADARERGRLEANLQRQRGRQLIGLQKTSLAGAGVDVAGASAIDLVASTASLAELDALTISSNAEREALGFEAQASGFGAEAGLQVAKGEQARTGSFFKAGATLLTGFGSVAKKWDAFNKLN